MDDREDQGDGGCERKELAPQTVLGGSGAEAVIVTGIFERWRRQFWSDGSSGAPNVVSLMSHRHFTRPPDLLLMSRM